MRETGPGHDVRGAELKMGISHAKGGTIGKRDDERIQGQRRKGKLRKGIERGKASKKVLKPAEMERGKTKKDR